MTATAAWSRVGRRFAGLLSGLPASAEQRAQAGAVGRLVAHGLRRALAAPGDGSDRGRAILLGGYAKGTAPRFSAAVDVLLVLPAHLRPDFSAGPTALGRRRRRVIAPVAAVLGERHGGVRIDADGWLVVRPARGSTSAIPLVRLRPVFACAEGGFLTPAPDGRQGPWRHLDPAAELANLEAADKATAGKATHLILMLKAWRRAQAVPIQPLALELLAAEFVRAWIYQTQSALFYDWMVRDFFFWAAAQAGRPLPLPGTGETLASGRAWRDAAEAAHVTAALASDLERDNREAEAAACWRHLFGAGLFAHKGAPSAAPSLPRRNTQGMTDCFGYASQ
ncbi:MAG: hypothetical protein EA406_13790 [Rhodospirillales bacterium]|nr:MAG: hypothetical protein EA406_13790 [Rhodospirillales bacterium]